MKYIPRNLLDNLHQFITPGKVVVLYGARRVGKTTLINEFIRSIVETRKIEQHQILFVNGDDITVRQNLQSQSINKLRDFIGDHKYLIIDEAQYIEKIGHNLKLIVDHIPNLRIIATGSSSFDLAKDIGEPLTGRRFVLRLFPLAQREIGVIEKLHETQANLESRLRYGTYPEVVTLHDNKQREEYLRELVSSYLFKDILELEGIRLSSKLVRLLQLVAFQIGKEVSHTELGTQLGMSKNTVERYLDLLEKVFVIFKRIGFSRNLRKEITKNPRYSFYDNGIRNAVIGNFNPLSNRNDVGDLWENYFLAERVKKHEYDRVVTNCYFWRTYSRSEIDLIEERNGTLFAYEIKWKDQRIRVPKAWSLAYPDSEFQVIHPDNYLDYLS